MLAKTFAYLMAKISKNSNVPYLQIHTTSYIVLLIGNVIAGNMIAWSALTDLDFVPWTSYVVPFCRQAFSIWICMASIESTVLRFFTKFVWKRMPPINHEFTVLFLNLFNMSFCCLLPIITGVSGSFQELFRLQGKSSYLRPKPIFNPK